MIISSTVWYRIIVSSLICIGVVLIAYLYVHQSYQDWNQSVLALQQTELKELERLVATRDLSRIATTSTAIATQCTQDEQRASDQAVAGLDTAQTNDEVLEVLFRFAECADTFAREQWVRAEALDAQLSKVESYNDMLATPPSGVSSVEPLAVSSWQTLVGTEQELSVYLTKLIDLQRDLIEARYKGNVEVVEELLEEVGVVQRTITRLRRERAELTDQVL